MFAEDTIGLLYLSQQRKKTYQPLWQISRKQTLNNSRVTGIVTVSTTILNNSSKICFLLCFSSKNG
jgi:hypothetical protein